MDTLRDSAVIWKELRRAALLVFVASALVAAGAEAQQAVAPTDAERYLKDVRALTTPEMEGRGDGTKGLTRAAKLIEARYKSLGLKPAGTKGYLQDFTVITGRKLLGGNELREEKPAAGNSATRTFKVEQDFVPLSFSASGRVQGSVVFAGYGITAPEFSRDDYDGLEVKGKIALVFRGEPAALSAKATHGGMTQHAALITKAINAKRHGAAALIVVSTKLSPNEEDVLLRFGAADGPEDAGIPCLHVKRAAVASWLPSGVALDKVQEDLDEGQPARQLWESTPPTELQMSVQIEAVRAQVNNVLAYLPGKTDEYVVVGAHYDHLGRGDAHSLAPSQIGQIHPGADDNASGTAGVLELARVFALLRGKLDRGILFASFAGEELGLLGSAEWVQHSTLPLEKAVAMMNMDMIGRIKDDKVFIGGVGTGSTLKADVEEATENGKAFHVEYSESGVSSSDHTSFVTKKIPVLFFFSGLHSDYHKPSDTWEKINSGAAVKLLDIVGKIGVEIADAPERPKFVEVVENPHAGGMASGSGGGYGPYFGSIPDFGQTENGVKFSDVRAGSPAAKAGFKAGDVLVQFGDMPIKNLYDFTDALRRHKVGDVVDVTVMRDGKPLKAAVTLEQRK